ncbi:MAG: hypothetical protein H7Z41_01055 [Cytophagales bacterium]|nr:hypothetical protein [Armatimonadota bacterium]
MPHTLRNLSRFTALLAFVAVAGTGCGGGTKYDDVPTDTDSGTIGAPVVVSGLGGLGTMTTRGTVPVFATNAATSQYFAINPTALTTLSYPPDTQLFVPGRYADREFVRWEQNGTPLSTLLAIPLTALSATSTATVRAVYQPFTPATAFSIATPATTGFTPNYNRSDNLRWASLPVRIFLDRSVTPTEETRRRIITGLDRWSQASGGLISYTLTTDRASANIEFLSGALPADVAGLTELLPASESTATEIGLIERAVITITPDFLNNVDQGSRRFLEVVATHEFGHALGIISTTDPVSQGHSTDPEDTMFASGNPFVLQITARDINTIADLYSDRYSASRAANLRRNKSTKPLKTITITCPKDLASLSFHGD